LLYTKILEGLQQKLEGLEPLSPIAGAATGVVMYTSVVWRTDIEIIQLSSCLSTGMKVSYGITA